MDAVRQSDRCQIPLGTRRHPSRVHHLRAHRDLARSGRRLSGRPFRAALGRSRRRLLVGIAWVINSGASSLPVLYFAAAIGGIGTGCVYGTCVGNALKWFPGRRGIAAGFTASGFGAGAALTIVPISHMIDSSGYEHAFLVFGLIQGGIVFVMSWLLLAPPRATPDGCGEAQSDGARLPPERGAAQSGVLCAVRDVRADRRGRPDHGGIHGADRQGLQDRQGSGRALRFRRCRRWCSRCR